MKKLIVLSMVAALSGAAVAGEGARVNNDVAATAEQNQHTDARASNDGNSQVIVFEAADGGKEQTIRYEGSYTVKNAPSMAAPNITSSNDTCMGSASGAVSGPGFGVSVGSTFTDDNCIMLKNARELWNMGMRAAALAHMCSDPEVAKSLEVTGYKCPARGDQPAASGSQGAPAPVIERDWNSMYHGG